MEIKKYIAENESGMLEELFSLIRIPSISAKPEHHDDMLACAERWAQLLLAAGADEALVMPSAGNSHRIRTEDCRPESQNRIDIRTLRRNARRTAGTLEKQSLRARSTRRPRSGRAVRTMTKDSPSSR